MVAAPPPHPILGGDLKISYQTNWGRGGGSEQKIKFGGGGKFKGRPMNPNDVMVIVLKDIFLC